MNEPYSTEAQLTDALEQLELAVETAKLGIWRLEVETGRLEWNDRLLEIYGLTREEFEERVEDWRERVHPEDRAAADARLAEVYEGRRVFDVFFRVVWPSGEIRWVAASAAPLKTKDGHVTELVGINIDVSAVRSQEEELERRAAFLRSIFDNSLAGIIVSDEAGNYVSANRAAAELFQISLERLLTMNVAELQTAMPGRAKAAFDDYRARVSQVGEFEFIRADGESRVAQFSASRMDDSHHVSVLIDTTESKRMSQQLLHAQKMDALGRLAGGIAHDLNNILMVINNAAELAQLELGTPEARELIAPVVEAGQRAARLVQRLLTFSRPHRGTPGPLDLDALVEGLEPMLERIVGPDVTLSVELAGDLPAVHADPGHIDQVLMNLVINARDAMPEGGTVTVRTRAEEVAAPMPETDLSPGVYVVLTVRDDGTGISDDVRAHIFEPYFTTKPRGKGSGLGLATVYSLVRQAGGDVVVESQPGEGSEFRVYLPATHITPPDRLGPQAEPASVAGGDETILVVEDEEGPRHVAVRMLISAGYRVLTAHDGRRALEQIEARGGGVDLVLTDLLMPGMSGRSLARRIQEEHPGLRLLFMTGFASDELLKGLDRDQLLIKPFTLTELLDRVRRTLDAPE